MTTLARIGIAVAFAAGIAGCAIAPTTAPSAVVTSPRKKAIAPDQVKDAVAIGKSTKADVLAALGRTLVIRFETGYEIWVYRFAHAPAAEFVILFDASGVVAKTRMRPAPNSPA